MGIWTILRTNFFKGSRTRKLTEVVEHPQAFRGLVLHDTSRCTACGTCAYVCSPGAITFEEGEDEIMWDYNAGRCTFCGRCVQFCPTAALSFSHESAPVVTMKAELYTDHAVSYSTCTRCGKKYIPLPASSYVKLYGDPMPADIAELRGLCETCRNKQATRKLKEAARGQLAKRAADHIDRSLGVED